MVVSEMIFDVSSVGDEVLLQTLLLDCNKNDINIPNSDGFTPLYIAMHVTMVIVNVFFC